MIVTTDRISAFDVILKDRIIGRDAVFTQLSRFWLGYTKDVMPNHMVSTDMANILGLFRTLELERRSMLRKKFIMPPIECIARGYIMDNSQEGYGKNRTVCDIQLPAGL